MDTRSRILKLALLADTSKFGSSLDNATKKTKTFGQRMDGVARGITRGMDAAAFAIAGMATKLAIDGVKAAIADEKAQVKLATTLKNTTKASNGQIKSVEKYIDKLQRATGVADDKLRPSLEKLLVATGKVGKAQKLQALAMDIAAGTGKDLDTVSLSLAKAYGGNLGALTRMGITLDESIIKNKDFKAAQEELDRLFGGQSAAAAETMEGKFKRFNIAVDEAKESIGVALMPTIEKMVDYLNSPKGQKVVTDFAEGFANAMVLLAEKLPGILTQIEKIGKTAGNLGIKWDSFADPKLVAAAAAFRYAPGGMKGKVIAGLIAYGATAAAGPIMDIKTDSNASIAGGALKSVGEAGIFGAVGKQFGQLGGVLQIAGNAQSKADRQERRRIQNNIVINIQNASDAISSARAIKRTLEKLELNGGSGVGVLGFN